MSNKRDLPTFQNDVRNLLGPSQNFAIDRPHDGMPEHVDLTTRFPGGAHKISVNFDGDIIKQDCVKGVFTKMDY